MPSDEDEPLIPADKQEKVDGESAEEKRTEGEAGAKAEPESTKDTAADEEESAKPDKESEDAEEKGKSPKRQARAKKPAAKEPVEKKPAEKKPTKEKASKPEKAKKKEEEEEAEEEEEEEKEDEKAGSYWKVDPSKKRERKSLEQFHPEVPKHEIVIEKGSGKKLKDIPGVVARIQEHVISKKNKDDSLKILSRMLFNRIPGPKELKENLLEFSGKVFKDKKEEENFRQIRVGKRTTTELKGILEAELADRLFEFLKTPSNNGVKSKKGVKGSRPSKSPTSDKKRKTPSKKGGKEEAEDTEDDDEEEEEEEEEKPKPPPAKKSRTGRGKRDEEKDEKESEAPEEDEPAESDPELQKNVNTICESADLSLLTLRMVREQLEKDYNVDVKEKKDLIRKYVDEFVASQEAKKDS